MDEEIEAGFMSEDEVFEIIQATQVDDLLVVGGQSIAFWRSAYSHQSNWLRENLVASEDIDFFRNRTAANNLSSKYNVSVKYVKDDDNSPSDGQLLLPMNNRIVVVDFMRSIYGISDKELEKRAVVVQANHTRHGISFVFKVMHPFDCLVSRLSNVNGPLRRISEHSRSQTEASLHILKCHLDVLITDGKHREAYKYLQALEYVVKNNHIGKNSHKLFGRTVDPIALLESFMDDRRLDYRWRERILSSIIVRLKDRRERTEAREVRSGNNSTEDEDHSANLDGVTIPKM